MSSLKINFFRSIFFLLPIFSAVIKKYLNLSVMNRHLSLILSAALAIFLVGPACNKHLSSADTSRQDLIQQARKSVDSLANHAYPINYRASQPKTIRWDLSQLVTIGQRQGVLAPIVFDNDLLIKTNFDKDQLFHLNYLTHLLFYLDSSGKKTVLIITDFPDSNYFRDPTLPFTGIRFVEDWYGNPVKKLLIASDGRISRFTPTRTQPDLAELTQTCYSIVGYNYSPELNETVTWTEDAGCSTNFAPDGADEDLGSLGSNSPGSGGASGASPASLFTVLPGNSVIKSIKTYFQCFTNVGGTDHTYTVTVCVDQPDPGTREPWMPSGSGSSGSSSGDNPIQSGHTFLILSETYGNTTITRNVGFYPSGNVNPLAVISQGSLNDDETHAYNISGSFNVNNAQFFNVLNFVSQGNNIGYLYDLNTNNCTTFAINAVAQAGITLPRTIGVWVDGAGTDPGDLGEDIRMNNISGMTVNFSGGSGVSHYNVGQCN
jgi:hypothetical protein